MTEAKKRPVLKPKVKPIPPTTYAEAAVKLYGKKTEEKKA